LTIHHVALPPGQLKNGQTLNRISRDDSETVHIWSSEAVDTAGPDGPPLLGLAR
jgi:hypothetical protein